MYAAPHPLRFEAANGQVLPGGQRCTKMRLSFQMEKNSVFQPEPVEYEAEFYEADIKVDAILSFPWLEKKGLGIFPHRKALALDHPDLSFLTGLKNRRKISDGIHKEGLCVDEKSNNFLIKSKLRDFGLHLPEHGFDQKLKFLNDDDLEIIASHLVHLQEPPVRSIHRLITAREKMDSQPEAAKGSPASQCQNQLSSEEPVSEPEDLQEQKIQKWREDILAQYHDKFFRSKVFPDPPERHNMAWLLFP